MEITNRSLRVQLYLPDAEAGFYRGTRFDWSGVIGSLRFAGHEFYGRWFDRVDPEVHDFAYQGASIVSSPCTAMTGPAEEFVTNGQALGFDEAKPGQTFIKIGVGVLRRPDDKPYDPYRLYAIADGGRWTVTRQAAEVEFRHEVSDAATGYGYDYRKTVSLTGEKAQMTIGHTLRNTGRRTIETSVYNHNFLYLDRQAPGPGLSLTVPFKIQASPPLDPRLAVVQDNRLVLRKSLSGEDRVYAVIAGYGPGVEDHDFRVESREAGVGVRITGDRPLARVALWTIRAPYSIEPFIDLKVDPGTASSWRLRYEFDTVGKGNGVASK